MLTALTRPTGPELADCELTHIDRVPIDIGRAIAQHDSYLAALRSRGVQVVELPRLPDHPDAVFVEDTALVLDEIAVMLRPGVESRRGEVESVAAVLAEYRRCVPLEAPAALDGGDIVVLGRRILVGAGTRSSAAGAGALEEAVGPYGYSVTMVRIGGVLHLKSAATAIDDTTLIHYPGYVDLDFLDVRLLAVPEDEPHGANVVRVGDALLANSSAPRTLEMLTALGWNVVPVEVGEFAKAEGAISCKGIIFSP